MTRHVRPTEIRAANGILTEEQLRQVCPAFFAEAPSGGVSSRYAFIPSRTVLDGLMQQGFEPVAAGQSRTRSAERRAFAKHAVRFRRPGETMRAVNDVIPEIALVTSHDGSSGYRLDVGLFRLACLNGMVVPTGTTANMSVRHSGDAGRLVEEVVGVANEVLKLAVTATDAAKEWAKIPLNFDTRLALAEGAIKLRYPDGSAPIGPLALLGPRRPEDESKDLWTIFNVLQENVIRGGLVGAPGPTGRRRITRAIKGIDQDAKLNKALWTLCAKVAEEA